MARNIFKVPTGCQLASDIKVWKKREYTHVSVDKIKLHGLTQECLYEKIVHTNYQSKIPFILKNK